jgi:hypothetical protein
VNVLLIHAPIGDKPLYPGQELLKPRAFLRDHPFDLVVCGDYHYTFQDAIGDRAIVNAGCLVRKTTSEADRKLRPCVFVWNSKDRTLSQHYLKVCPPAEVFCEAILKPDASANEYLVHLLESLNTNRKLTSDFFDNLDRFLETEKQPRGVQNIIRAAVAETKQHAEGSK